MVSALRKPFSTLWLLNASLNLSHCETLRRETFVANPLAHENISMNSDYRDMSVTHLCELEVFFRENRPHSLDSEMREAGAGEEFSCPVSCQVLSRVRTTRVQR